MLDIPSSAVRAKRSSRRAAPSSMEYSVWTCRWTKSPPVTGADDMGGAVLLSDTSGNVVSQSGRQERRAWTDQLGEEPSAYATTPLILAGHTDSPVARPPADHRSVFEKPPRRLAS